jgi:hypothetical protein
MILRVQTQTSRQRCLFFLVIRGAGSRKVTRAAYPPTVPRLSLRAARKRAAARLQLTFTRVSPRARHRWPLPAITPRHIHPDFHPPKPTHRSAPINQLGSLTRLHSVEAPRFSPNPSNAMTITSIFGTGALILGLLFAAFPRVRRPRPTSPESPEESPTPSIPDSATVAGVPLRHLLSDHSGPGAVLRDRLSTGPPPDAH